MVQTITRWQFQDAFRHAGRGEQFSHRALNALFDYFEQMEDDTGQPFELDVIAICCDYSEATAAEINEWYGISDRKGSALMWDVTQWLEENSQIVGEPEYGSESGESDAETVFVFFSAI